MVEGKKARSILSLRFRIRLGFNDSCDGVVPCFGREVVTVVLLSVDSHLTLLAYSVHNPLRVSEK